MYSLVYWEKLCIKLPKLVKQNLDPCLRVFNKPLLSCINEVYGESFGSKTVKNCCEYNTPRYNHVGPL